MTWANNARDVGEIGPVLEQRLERIAFGSILEVTGDRDQLEAFIATRIVNPAHPFRLRLASARPPQAGRRPRAPESDTNRGGPWRVPSSDPRGGGNRPARDGGEPGRASRTESGIIGRG